MRVKDQIIILTNYFITIAAQSLIIILGPPVIAEVPGDVREILKHLTNKFEFWKIKSKNV